MKYDNSTLISTLSPTIAALENNRKYIVQISEARCVTATCLFIEYKSHHVALNIESHRQ